MRTLKIAVEVVLVFAAVLILIGLALPNQAHVERAVEIQAPPHQVYVYLNDLHNFVRWSPWSRLDPQTQYRFEGPPSGVGSRLKWSSQQPDVGSGSQEITASIPDKLISVHLEFADQGDADSFYELYPLQNGTRLVWGFDVKFGYDLVGRYFGLLMESLVGKEYEKGLANLKKTLDQPTD